MWFYFGLFLGAYVPTTFAGLIPDWVHVGLIAMALMALNYLNELAALARGTEGAKAEPLSNVEAVRARFAQTRREEALRRKQWQRGMPRGPKVAGMA